VIPIPSRRLLFLLTGPLCLMILSYFVLEFLSIALFLDAVVLVFCFYDYLYSAARIQINFRTDTPAVYSIGRKNIFTVVLYNGSDVAVSARITISIPEFFQIVGRQQPVRIEANTEKRYSIVLKPSRRGDFTIKKIFFRYDSIYRFFYLDFKKNINKKIAVFPDIKELNQYIRLSRLNRLSDIGIHRNLYRGMGTELESLREYHRDDDSKHIDWKVTTRINKPVTKVYQMESNNHIVLVLDCGRLMTSEQFGLSALDYAINGVLILSHIALKLGDNIRIIAFADKIIGEVPQTKGIKAINRINHFISGLSPNFVESNYSLAFEYLRNRLKKRSLVIFFTNMIDDIKYTIFKKYFGILNRRHITLFILLKDILLVKHADERAGTLDDLYTSVTARDMFLRRKEAIEKLSLQKINVLDILPQQVTPKLINKYLELKSKNYI
jgi:uncharacterized protein (DUF58 family)